MGAASPPSADPQRFGGEVDFSVHESRARSTATSFSHASPSAVFPSLRRHSAPDFSESPDSCDQSGQRCCLFASLPRHAHTKGVLRRTFACNKHTPIKPRLRPRVRGLHGHARRPVLPRPRHAHTKGEPRRVCPTDKQVPTWCRLVPRLWWFTRPCRSPFSVSATARSYQSCASA